MKLLLVLSLVTILNMFQGNGNGQLIQNGCIQASNGTLPLPNFVRPEDSRSAPRSRGNPIQAIITSYRFDCCGVVSEWRAFVEGASGRDCYSISFEVWRVNSSLGDSCYSKIGANYLQDMCLGGLSSLDPQRGLINVTVPESEWISVEPGDVVGLNLTSTDDDNGILFSRDELYTNESVLYSINSNRIEPTSLCNAEQFRSTNSAPLITAIIVPTKCIETTRTSAPQLSSTFPAKNSEITTQRSTASLESATTHTSMQLNRESSATTTKLIPKPTNSVLPNMTEMNAGAQMLTIGVAIGVTSVVMLIILFVCVVCCAIVKWKRKTSTVTLALNKPTTTNKKATIQRTDYDTAGEDTYEKIDHIHTEAKQNLAQENDYYDNNEGEVEMKLTQNKAYGNINHPSVPTIEDELYDNVNVAAQDEGNYDYVTITNVGVRQSSSDNDPSIPTTENEVYTSVTADTEREEIENTYECLP